MIQSAFIELFSFDISHIFRTSSSITFFGANFVSIRFETNSGSIPTIASGQPFISVDIFYCQDKEHFLECWGSPPQLRGNTRLGRFWDEIGQTLFNMFIHSEEPSPWQLLIKWLEDSSLMAQEVRAIHFEFKKYLEEDQPEYWQKLQTTHINDKINITLFRNDNTRAGSLEDNGLSDGQKNTALLALLFAHGTNPIIIDQPEDELDSDFIYNELVPLLRKVKNKRQIILSTHNANIPVNGDSELVYSLIANNGKGKVRAEGGLETPHVRTTVLQVMEGSEEAFKRRREKYAF